MYELIDFSLTYSIDVVGKFANKVPEMGSPNWIVDCTKLFPSKTKTAFRLNKKIKDQVPFAVIGSNCVLQIGDKRIRARQYPWGVAEVENKSHCDFRILRDMLIRTHMQDLIDVTSVVHYENFRARKLSNVMSSKLTGKSPMGKVICYF